VVDIKCTCADFCLGCDVCRLADDYQLYGGNGLLCLEDTGSSIHRIFYTRDLLYTGSSIHSIFYTQYLLYTGSSITNVEVTRSSEMFINKFSPDYMASHLRRH